jgi:ADP-ribose pyrophosphatase YjhB (NUDIX family)
MEIKILVIGVVKKGNQILLRKKPAGSPPYRETWYLFGGELTAEKTPEIAVQEILKIQAGIEVRLAEKLGWDTEIKKDVDGIEKYFIYLDALCEYVSGELVPGRGIEKLEWADIDKLDQYDHVPPSKILLRKLGYLKS